MVLEDRVEYASVHDGGHYPVVNMIVSRMTDITSHSLALFAYF